MSTMTDFRRVLIAQTLSVHGDQISATALAFAVLRSAGPVDLSIVLATKIAALSVFSIIGGTLADRRSPRDVMLGANVLCCTAQSLTAILLGIGHIDLAMFLPLQAASSAGTGIFRPAATALTPSIVSRDHLLRANALLGMSSNVAMTVGPALGAALMAAAGARTALAVDAFTFAAAVLLVAGVRAEPRQRTTSRMNFRDSLREGWSEVRGRRPVLTMIIFFAGYQLVVTSTLGSAGPARADLIGGPRAWSVVLGGMGVGMILGGIFAPQVRIARPLRMAVLLSASIGFALPTLALCDRLMVIAAAFVMAGIALEIGNVLWLTVLQSAIPRDRLARVSSFDWFASTSLRPVGLVLNGAAIAEFGPIESLCTAAILVVPIALVATVLIGTEGRDLASVAA